TYPSGMILAEREQLERQARKAVHVFKSTIGRKQDMEPDFNLSIDEASAVHLTYIWSEIQKLGRKPSLWFQLMGRTEQPATAENSSPEEQAPATAAESAPMKRPAMRRRPQVGSRSRAGRGGGAESTPPLTPELPEVRVACIDIGGGTTDLMIAKYTCEPHSGGDRVFG